MRPQALGRLFCSIHFNFPIWIFSGKVSLNVAFLWGSNCFEKLVVSHLCSCSLFHLPFCFFSEGLVLCSWSLFLLPILYPLFRGRGQPRPWGTGIFAWSFALFCGLTQSESHRDWNFVTSSAIWELNLNNTLIWWEAVIVNYLIGNWGRHPTLAFSCWDIQPAWVVLVVIFSTIFVSKSKSIDDYWTVCFLPHHIPLLSNSHRELALFNEIFIYGDQNCWTRYSRWSKLLDKIFLIWSNCNGKAKNKRRTTKTQHEQSWKL